MDYKLNLLTPCVYSKPGNDNCIDQLAEQFAEYVKFRSENEFHLPCKYNKDPGLAFIHRFEDFEERFLIHSEYAVIIGTPNSKKSLNQFLPRLLVFLSMKSIWQNRFLIVLLGETDVLDNLVVDPPIKFSLNNWKEGDEESWKKLFGLVKIEWVPYQEPSSLKTSEDIEELPKSKSPYGSLKRSSNKKDGSFKKRRTSSGSKGEVKEKRSKGTQGSKVYFGSSNYILVGSSNNIHRKGLMIDQGSQTDDDSTTDSNTDEEFNNLLTPNIQKLQASSYEFLNDQKMNQKMQDNQLQNQFQGKSKENKSQSAETIININPTPLTVSRETIEEISEEQNVKEQSNLKDNQEILKYNREMDIPKTISTFNNFQGTSNEKEKKNQNELSYLTSQQISTEMSVDLDIGNKGESEKNKLENKTEISTGNIEIKKESKKENEEENNQRKLGISLDIGNKEESEKNKLEKITEVSIGNIEINKEPRNENQEETKQSGVGLEIGNKEKMEKDKLETKVEVLTGNMDINKDTRKEYEEKNKQQRLDRGFDIGNKEESEKNILEMKVEVPTGNIDINKDKRKENEEENKQQKLGTGLDLGNKEESERNILEMKVEVPTGNIDINKDKIKENEQENKQQILGIGLDIGNKEESKKNELEKITEVSTGNIEINKEPRNENQEETKQGKSGVGLEIGNKEKMEKDKLETKVEVTTGNMDINKDTRKENEEKNKQKRLGIGFDKGTKESEKNILEMKVEVPTGNIDINKDKKEENEEKNKQQKLCIGLEIGNKENNKDAKLENKTIIDSSQKSKRTMDENQEIMIPSISNQQKSAETNFSLELENEESLLNIKNEKFGKKNELNLIRDENLNKNHSEDFRKIEENKLKNIAKKNDSVLENKFEFGLEGNEEKSKIKNISEEVILGKSKQIFKETDKESDKFKEDNLKDMKELTKEKELSRNEETNNSSEENSKKMENKQIKGITDKTDEVQKILLEEQILQKNLELGDAGLLGHIEKADIKNTDIDIKGNSQNKVELSKYNTENIEEKSKDKVIVIKSSLEQYKDNNSETLQKLDENKDFKKVNINDRNKQNENIGLGSQEQNVKNNFETTDRSVQEKIYNSDIENKESNIMIQTEKKSNKRQEGIEIKNKNNDENDSELNNPSLDKISTSIESGYKTLTTLSLGDEKNEKMIQNNGNNNDGQGDVEENSSSWFGGLLKGFKKDSEQSETKDKDTIKNENVENIKTIDFPQKSVTTAKEEAHNDQNKSSSWLGGFWSGNKSDEDKIKNENEEDIKIIDYTQKSVTTPKEAAQNDQTGSLNEPIDQNKSSSWIGGFWSGNKSETKETDSSQLSDKKSDEIKNQIEVESKETEDNLGTSKIDIEEQIIKDENSRGRSWIGGLWSGLGSKKSNDIDSKETNISDLNNTQKMSEISSQQVDEDKSQDTYGNVTDKIEEQIEQSQNKSWIGGLLSGFGSDGTNKTQNEKNNTEIDESHISIDVDNTIETQVPQSKSWFGGLFRGGDKDDKKTQDKDDDTVEGTTNISEEGLEEKNQLNNLEENITNKNPSDILLQKINQENDQENDQEDEITIQIEDSQKNQPKSWFGSFLTGSRSNQNDEDPEALVVTNVEGEEGELEVEQVWGLFRRSRQTENDRLEGEEEEIEDEQGGGSWKIWGLFRRSRQSEEDELDGTNEAGGNNRRSEWRLRNLFGWYRSSNTNEDSDQDIDNNEMEHTALQSSSTSSLSSVNNKITHLIFHPIGGCFVILSGTLLSPYWLLLCNNIHFVPAYFNFIDFRQLLILFSRRIIHEDQLNHL